MILTSQDLFFYFLGPHATNPNRPTMAKFDIEREDSGLMDEKAVKKGRVSVGKWESGEGGESEFMIVTDDCVRWALGSGDWVRCGGRRRVGVPEAPETGAGLWRRDGRRKHAPG